MRAQFFHYKILETKPITALEEFKEHPRLKVFHLKGCKCVECGIEATQIALGEGKGKKAGKHWDVYTSDFYPLTVDHIIPKSRGGGEGLDNKQPMCYKCNQKKGSRLPGEENEPGFGESNIYTCIGHTCKWPRRQNKYYEKFIPVVGDEVFRRSNTHIFKYLGIVSQIVINPHTDKDSYMVKGNDTSMYGINNAYKPL